MERFPPPLHTAGFLNSLLPGHILRGVFSVVSWDRQTPSSRILQALSLFNVKVVWPASDTTLPALYDPPSSPGRACGSILREAPPADVLHLISATFQRV